MADPSVTATQVLLVSGPRGAGVAGGTITPGQVLYRDSADGKLKPAVATTLATAAAVGIALEGVAANQPLHYAGDGAVVDLGAGAAPAAGLIYLVSGTAGGLSPHTDATTPATGEFATVVCVGIGSNRVRVGLLASGVAAA